MQLARPIQVALTPTVRAAASSVRANFCTAVPALWAAAAVPILKYINRANIECAAISVAAGDVRTAVVATALVLMMYVSLLKQEPVGHSAIQLRLGFVTKWLRLQVMRPIASSTVASRKVTV